MKISPNILKRLIGISKLKWFLKFVFLLFFQCRIASQSLILACQHPNVWQCFSVPIKFKFQLNPYPAKFVSEIIFNIDSLKCYPLLRVPHIWLHQGSKCSATSCRWVWIIWSSSKSPSKMITDQSAKLQTLVTDFLAVIRLDILEAGLNIKFSDHCQLSLNRLVSSKK